MKESSEPAGVAVDRDVRPSAAVRIRVMKRDRFRCVHCGVPGTDAELETDHIIPVAKGGSHHVSNLQTLCRNCNQKKGAGQLEGDEDRAVRFRNRRSDGESALEGLWLHTLKDGKIQLQGHIIGVVGETCLVQLFEWWDGRPTRVQKIDTTVILGPSVALYASDVQMREAYDRYSEEKQRHHAA